MEYYEVLYKYTTTNGDEYAVIITGNGTADVETIKLNENN